MSLVIAYLAPGAHAYLPRARLNWPLKSTPSTVGRFIDRLGFKILLKLPGLVVLVLLQERAAGEPNSNPVPWSIAAAALWFHPPLTGLAFARGLGDTLCPGTSVSREA